MCCLIPQVLRLLKMRCDLSRRQGCFLIEVYCHDFAFSTHLMNFAIVPAIFISHSFEIIAKTLSVALEMSLSIYVY